MIPKAGIAPFGNSKLTGQFSWNIQEMGIVPGGGSVLLYLGAHKFIEKIQKDTIAAVHQGWFWKVRALPEGMWVPGEGPSVIIVPIFWHTKRPHSVVPRCVYWRSVGAASRCCESVDPPAGFAHGRWEEGCWIGLQVTSGHWCRVIFKETHRTIGT